MRFALPLRLVPLFAVAAISACTGDASSPVRLQPGAPDHKKTVQASESDLVLMVRTPTAPVGARGGTARQLDAGIFGKKGKAFPNKNEKFYEWRSSDPTVATVDSTGLVTAVGVGSASIIVDYKDAADTIGASVVPVPVRSVRVTGLDSISMDDTVTYAAVIADSAGEPLVGRAVAWSSSNPAALAVGETTGEGVALAEGTAIVSARSEEGVSGSATTKVWPQPVATIDVSPAVHSIALYRENGLAFSATPRDRRGKVLTGRLLTWRTSDAGVFTIGGLTGAVSAVAPGEAQAIAESEGKSGSGTLTVTNPVEARVLWVTRFDFSNAGHVRTIIQKAKQAKFNAVYLQVRTAGDALYKSTIEPCSPRVCNGLGGATMSYDPLAVAIEEAGEDLEVHAWLNSMTAWISNSATNCNGLVASTPMHMAKAHPEWVLTAINGVVTPCLTTPEYIWFSPGVPEVRTQLARVASELLRTYPGLKGIHLDRIRYPGTTWSYDAPSVNAFKAANNGVAPTAFNPAWAELRRGFVNAAVKEVFDTMRVVRPSAVLSAAVWPIYQTMPSWSGHSKGYSDYFQDPRAWTSGGYLDVAAPMTYPATTGSLSYVVKPSKCDSLDWHCLFSQHQQVIEGRDRRHVYIGIGAIKGWAEMEKQIRIARREGATGISVYSYGTMQANSPTAWANLETGFFEYPATIPAMPWK
jgi:uncharacterized lipoprotein YddW (UPF0748 family)